MNPQVPAEPNTPIPAPPQPSPLQTTQAPIITPPAAPGPTIIPVKKKSNGGIIILSIALFVLILVAIGAASYLKQKGTSMPDDAPSQATNFPSNLQEFLGKTPSDQKARISKLVNDGSEADAIVLYSAASIAYNLDDKNNAVFLFYAAQLRKAFDTQRFGLTQPNGNNVETLLDTMNESLGQTVNQLAFRDAAAFSYAMEKLKAWDIVSDETSPFYTQYGTPILDKSKWKAAAETVRTNYTTNFFDKLTKFQADPANIRKIIFIQDYNAGKIDKNEENTQKYQEYTQAFQKVFN